MARRNRLYRRARRDIRVSQAPAIRGARRDYRAAQQGVESAYGGFQDQIADLGPQYEAQTADIAGDLTSQLGELRGLLGGNMAPGEGAAGTMATQTLGAGGLELLASQAQRNLGYQTSAVREGALAQRAASSNLTQQLLDTLDQIRFQNPALIRQRVDELREQRLTRQLARSQMQSDEAMNAFIQAQIEQILGRENRNNNGNGRNNNGGNGGN